MLRTLSLALALTLALPGLADTKQDAEQEIEAATKAKKPPRVAHPHLQMLKLRLAKFLPPGQDKNLEDIKLQYTVVADGTVLRQKTIDFLVREFAPAVANKAGLEAVAGICETIPLIDSADAAQVAADRLRRAQKKALNTDIKDKDKRLGVATLAQTLRGIAKRAAEDEVKGELSLKQRYTRDSFESDKLGDDIARIFRSTVDIGLDSEDDGLGALVDKHLRELTAFAMPELPKKVEKKKKKKRKKRRRKKRG